ncbi:leucine-rich repeat-containing protein 34 isoform X2 [Stegostoma tigrinum]|uniref:leucine-rich repeat-containing protein 34 isoform X2 n=1 Tax=Stegostoma tigrinum TaxID=3053191 RepID=UPI00202AE6C0|nr:leucine-rich repeat-containing protein 34 isoform X2 [Stegostoma tigrinum]
MDFTLYHGESRVTSPGRLTEFYLQTCAELEKKPNPYIQEVIGHADGLPPGTTYGGFTLILNGNTRLFPNHKPTDDDVSVLVHVLHRHTYITGIDLPYSNLTNCAAEMFGKLLLNSTTLTDLNLMCNEIGSHGAKWLAKGLQEIQSLIALATVLHHNKSLRAIDVRGPIIHTIQEEETVHMAHMLQVNHTLQELHLVKMGMTNFGIQQLCDKLVHNKSLRLLDLHCNQISSDGAKSLAELLKHNTPLKILDLAANRIEDDGLVCISDALRYLNDQLVALSVARNNISGIGLMALANALKSNNTLTNVYVWGNSFDESASIDFAKLIKAGRLKPKRTDISPYWIDGRVYLSELAHGLQLYYYWTPLYGDVDEAACNANTYLLKDPNISLSQIDIEESVDTSSIEGNQSF